MSSLNRMLAVLDLFTPQTPAWTADAIAKRLDYTQPTVYRYLRELGKAGLLHSDTSAAYVLGSRIVEWDYQIRTGDPLIRAAGAPIEALAEESGFDVVLGSMHDDRIITIHHALGGDPIDASYGRGRRLPLFRGSLSWAIIAALPRARSRKLHSAMPPAEQPAWNDVLAKIADVRRAEHAVSFGELDSGLVGLSISLDTDPLKVPAALGMIIRQERFDQLERAALLKPLRRCAQAIESALSRLGPRAPLSESTP